MDVEITIKPVVLLTRFDIYAIFNIVFDIFPVIL